MDFDPRIGQRYEVQGVSARWEPHLNSDWVQRLRRARGEDSTWTHHGPGAPNAIIRNVSVSGAGVVAPADNGAVPGTPVTVVLGPGSQFDALIRRVLPGDEIGWAYFGVEFTSISEGFGTWLDHLMSVHDTPASTGTRQPH